MKGWKKSAPKRGKQRSATRRKCGSKCFLKPSTNGFPICARGSCKTSCKGLLAAKTRARQYKYSGIASKAQTLAVRKGCGWTHGSRRTSRRRSQRRSRRSSRRSRRSSRKVSRRRRSRRSRRHR